MMDPPKRRRRRFLPTGSGDWRGGAGPVHFSYDPTPGPFIPISLNGLTPFFY
jgi:hypothetical protein